MPRVLAIAGSLRRQSFNRLLLRAAVAAPPAGLKIDLYDDLGSIPMFDEDLEQAMDGGPRPVQSLRRLLGEADGLLIATPEYNWSVPGVLKNAIDWLSRPPSADFLAGKPAAVIGASSGQWGTRLAQNALRQILAATECAVMPAPALFVRDAASRFDAAGHLTDASTRKQLDAVLQAFSAWMAMHERARA